ncbi:helix-turn-helix domain-containing protein [Priestia endophytica]
MSFYKKDYTITLNKEQVEQVQRLVTYENFRREFMRGEGLIQEEDIFYAALNYYLNSIESFYKREVFNREEQLNTKKLINLDFRRLLNEREDKIKQKDIARIIGVDSAHINQILSNKTAPSLDIFIKLWIFFDKPSLDELIKLKNI